MKVEADQSQCHQGDEDKRDLEVRVQYQCGAVELHELALRAIERFGFRSATVAFIAQSLTGRGERSGVAKRYTAFR
jgi:hypothetical protein